MLNRALQVAENSTMKHKLGAVIYKGGRVLRVGWNVERNRHPTMEIDPNDYSTHAEIMALNLLPGGLRTAEGATIYVARIGRSRPSLNALPCLACRTTLEVYGIKRVVTTT